MIPILYESTETQFLSNGLGRLSDCTKCRVTEQKNGIYECEFQYPVSGVHYEDIQEGRIISVTHDDTQTRQAFDIYSRSAPINGLVTFYARHISYRLRNIILKPHTSQTVVEALANFSTYSINDNPFTFWTDKETVAPFKVEYPVSIKECLVGKQGSIIDVYGGEWAYDNFIVRLYNERGQDTSVTLRGGKNITNITQKLDAGETYTAVVPYWLSRSDETVVTLPEGYVTASNAPGYIKPAPLDLSDRWDTAPTEAQLREEAVRRLTAAEPWNPKENVEVNFVALWQTDEYANVAPLQRVNLCDKVSVIYPELGINVQKQVIKTIYDVLLERYEKIELGDNVRSLSSVYKSDIQEAIAKEVPSKTSMQNAISYATQLISGGLGGHVVFKQNANGEPEEILIMDTDDINTAVNVLRMNYQGIAFSRNGYDPSAFSTAWTIDGHFSADFIDTGTLNANLMKTGIIIDKQGKNYWNLDTGAISIKLDPGDVGAVTPADLDRVENNAQTWANAAEDNAKSYASGLTQELSGSVDLTIQGLETRFSNTYATKTELNEAKSGNITLQIPYEYGNGFVTFNAVVYNGVDDVTSKYSNNLFEWFVKSEAQDGLTPIGIGKTISVDTSDAKFGKTVVCRFTAVDDPRYWTDHNGNIITDHNGNPLGFVAVSAHLAVEATVYQQGYTESRFSSLELTTERFAVEIGEKLNEQQAQALIDVTADSITQSVSSTYATKEALSQAIYGDVTLQSPYDFENGIAKFRAVVYRGVDDVTSEYPAGLFRWYLRREDIDDKQLLGTGKNINVNTETAKYGMTVVCEFRFLGDAEPWTDHEGNEITDHEGNVFYFRSVKAILENETNLYQKNYTESRFAALTITDEEIRAEVVSRSEEMGAAIAAEKERAEGQESSLSEANQTNAANIAAEVLRAKGVEGDIQTAVATNAHNIEEAYSRITQTSNAITAEVSRAKTSEQTITASVTSVDSRVTSTNNALTAEVQRATGAESTINGTLTSHGQTLTSHGQAIQTNAEGLATANTNISTNAKAITSATGRITTAEGAIQDANGRIDDAEGAIQTANGRIADNAANISTANGRIDANAADIQTANGRLTTAEGNIADNAASISSLDGRMDDAEEQIEINVREIETTKSSIELTDKNLTAEISRATDVESSLRTQGRNNALAIGEVNDKANALTTRVEEAETKIDATADGLSVEVTRATAAEETLDTKIDITAEGVKLYADQVSLVQDNLIVMSTALFGYLLDADGSVYKVTTQSSISRAYITSDFMPVKSETLYTLQVWVEVIANIYIKIAYYDKDKTFISTIPSGTSVRVHRYEDYYKFQETTPAGAAYARVSFGNLQSDATRCWAKFEEGEGTRYVDSTLDSRYATSKHASLEVTVDGIQSTVSEKVGKDEVISTINQTSEQITIQANRINLNGAISGNGNFAIDTYGNLTITNAHSEGYVYGADILGGRFLTVYDTEEANDGYIEVVGNKVYTSGDSYLTNIPEKCLWLKTLDGYWLNYGDYEGADLRSSIACTMNIGNNEMFNIMANSPLGEYMPEESRYLPVDEEDWYYNRNKKFLNNGANLYTNLHVYGNTFLKGQLSTTGKKNRVVETKDFGRVTLGAYENPTPMFGDIGTGRTDENGEAYISIDEIFAQTVNLNVEYCVFLQKEGQGDIWVDAKEADHFVVKGTPNLPFSWELKAVQRGYEMDRLTVMDDETAQDESIFDDDFNMDEELSSLDELDKDMELLVADYDREVREMEIRNYEDIESVSGY